MTGRPPAPLTGSLLSHGDDAVEDGVALDIDESAPPPAPSVDPSERPIVVESENSGPAVGWRGALLLAGVTGFIAAVVVVAGSLFSDAPESAAGDTVAATQTSVPVITRQPAPPATAKRALRRAPTKGKAAAPVQRRPKSPARKAGRPARIPPPPPPPPAADGSAGPSHSALSKPRTVIAQRPLSPKAAVAPRAGGRGTDADANRRLAAVPDPGTLVQQPPKPTAVIRDPRLINKPPPVKKVIPPAGRRKPAVPMTAFAIQLSALRSESAARREVARLRLRLRPLLDGRDLRIRPSVSSGSPVFRVHLDGFDNAEPARRLCARIRASKFNCLVVRR